MGRFPGETLVLQHPDALDRVVARAHRFDREAQRHPPAANQGAAGRQFDHRRQHLGHVHGGDVHACRARGVFAAVRDDGADEIAAVEQRPEAVAGQEQRFAPGAAVDVVAEVPVAPSAGVVVAAAAVDHPLIVGGHEESQVRGGSRFAVRGAAAQRDAQARGVAVQWQLQLKLPLGRPAVAAIRLSGAGGVQPHGLQVEALLAQRVPRGQVPGRHGAEADLVVRVDAGVPQRAPGAAQGGHGHADTVGGVPEVQRLVVAAAADGRAVGAQGHRGDAVVVAVVGALEAEGAAGGVVHVDLHGAEVGPARLQADDQLAAGGREGQGRRTRFGGVAGHQPTTVVVAQHAAQGVGRRARCAPLARLIAAGHGGVGLAQGERGWHQRPVGLHAVLQAQLTGRRQVRPAQPPGSAATA